MTRCRFGVQNGVIPHGNENDFLSTEVVVNFPPETESRMEKQTTTDVIMKSYRPCVVCILPYVLQSVESITL